MKAGKPMACVIELALANNCTHTGPVRENFASGCAECADLAIDVVQALIPAGFGDVICAEARALEDAAEEMARLKAIGQKPYGECTHNELADYYPYVHGSHEQWLRARAADMRGES